MVLEPFSGSSSCSLLVFLASSERQKGKFITALMSPYKGFNYLFLASCLLIPLVLHERTGNVTFDTQLAETPSSREFVNDSFSAPCVEMDSVVWCKFLAASKRTLFRSRVLLLRDEMGICHPA